MPRHVNYLKISKIMQTMVTCSIAIDLDQFNA